MYHLHASIDKIIDFSFQDSKHPLLFTIIFLSFAGKKGIYLTKQTLATNNTARFLIHVESPYWLHFPFSWDILVITLSLDV